MGDDICQIGEDMVLSLLFCHESWLSASFGGGRLLEIACALSPVTGRLILLAATPNRDIGLSSFLSYTRDNGNDTTHQLEKEKMMKVLFVAGFGPIVSDRQESAAISRESLGLSFQEEADGYLHTEELEGGKTFALWPLSQAAQSCFGVNEWPADLPTPTRLSR